MKKTDQRTVVLTFDDGLANQFTVALPILEQYGFGASLFVGQWIGGVFPDAPAHCITKEQLLALHQKGFDIGNHTMTHPAMDSCDRQRLIREFEGVEELFASIGLPRPVTAAYPGGPATALAAEVLEERGYIAARTCEPKALDGTDSPFALPAFSVSVTHPENFALGLAALSPDHPVILVYHGLPSLHYPPCGIQPEVFQQQMASLHQEGIRCISLHQFMEEAGSRPQKG